MKLLTLALLLAATAQAFAQTYCFDVKVVGAGKPIILIPGLTCGGDVWDGTVAQLKAKYQCHVLSLPGFAGRPPIEGPYLTHVRDDILAYVKNNHLDHPAVIGHSLGGTLTFALAEADPGLWGPLVSVDGLPFLALAYYPHASAESVKSVSESIANQLRTATPGAFKAGIHANLVADITNPKEVEAMYATCSLSDQATTAEAMKELLATDLRPKLGTILSPVLLIGAGMLAQNEAEKKLLKETYQGQIKTIPHAKLIMDYGARHFVMLDDPKNFIGDVEAFLGSS